ncbi:MFS general substrate transporter [Auriculariales sp. MPI-PUGE-AT-0066]|nr:MFS general substrate transporter [Auriculariales sp. MPI-PUGE-AT-0066]
MAAAQRSPEVLVESHELPVLRHGLVSSSSAEAYDTRKLDEGSREERPMAFSEADNGISVDSEQTPQQRRTELIRFLSLLYGFFLMGWQDGTTGPMLPTLRAYYRLGFAEITSLFILQCCGAAFGAFSIVFVLQRFGFGKVLVAGTLAHAVSMAVQSSAPPFPAFATCSFFIGWAQSVIGAAGNGYVASLQRDGSRKMGVLHAAYGLGAFAAPLVSTSFAAFTGRKFAFLYILTAGLGASGAALYTLIFRFKRIEVLLAETGEKLLHNESADVRSSTNTLAALRSILAVPLVHCMAIFAAIYVGVEITIGGWVVTFIIDERSGGPGAGYISAGFFGGLMLGRVLLLPLNSWVGERRVIFGYALLTIALDIVVWRVPSLVGNAVAVSFMGMLLGPWFPIVMRETGLLLPPSIVTGAIGYISGFGIIGGAVVPTITGVLASRFEIKVMPIVVLVMTSLMIFVWSCAAWTSRKFRGIKID